MTDKKLHIINHALELFAEKGFEGSSIRDLAARAGVNVAMVNYYFGSKEKLFESLVEERASYSREVLDEIAKNTSYSDIEKIDHIIDNYIKKLFTNRKFHRVLHQEMMLNQRETLQQAIVEILYPNSRIIKGVIEAGMKNGSFRKVDPPLVIATIAGTINQLLLSKRMCIKLLEKDADYIPYEDPRFAKRLGDHLKQLMHAHLLNHSDNSKK
ncbi:MAG TPA: TetR family transcriptional regulator [Chitinophagaceae bacterium]|nr:TetR family transcriptional regulator [Chitinophagaceae bacterium]